MKISIITATYNSADTIAHCLDSLRRQTHGDIEHIVIDGASTDRTLELLRDAGSSISVLVSEPDNGIYDALNKGLSRATGDIVGFLHSDDYYADDEVLTHVVQAFAEPGTDAVFGDLDYVRKSNVESRVRRWRAGTFSPSKLRLGWMPPHPTLFVRRDLYTQIGGFDASLKIAADYLSILQLFSRPGLCSVYVPRVLIKMRVGGASNRSLSNVLRKSREDLDALRRTGVGGVVALIAKNLRKLPQFI